MKLTEEQVRQARTALAGVVDAVAAGELAADEMQLAHLRGSLAALDALAGGGNPAVGD